MNLNVYVIHAAPLAVRKQMIEALVTKLKVLFAVTTTYITDHDPSSININAIRPMIDLNKTGKSELFDSLARNIHIKQLSNTLKHIEALKMASTSPDYSLIIEDDVLYTEDVATKLSDFIKTLKQQTWDIAFTGLPQPTPKDGVEHTGTSMVVNDVFKIIPSCESYIVSQTGAKQLLEIVLPIRFPTHIQFSYLYTMSETLKCIMATPSIFIDGSKYGVYLSSLEPNNRLFLNAEYNRLQAMVNKTKDEKYTKAEEEAIENIVMTMKFKNHPDNLYQIGLFEMRRGHYEKARDVFEAVYTAYLQNDCILNNESEFLLNYSRVFKDLQKDLPTTIIT